MLTDRDLLTMERQARAALGEMEGAAGPCPGRASCFDVLKLVGEAKALRARQARAAGVAAPADDPGPIVSRRAIVTLGLFRG